jgi:hypothetical protein
MPALETTVGTAPWQGLFNASICAKPDDPLWYLLFPLGNINDVFAVVSARYVQGGSNPSGRRLLRQIIRLKSSG